MGAGMGPGGGVVMGHGAWVLESRLLSLPPLKELAAERGVCMQVADGGSPHGSPASLPPAQLPAGQTICLPAFPPARSTCLCTSSTVLLPLFAFSPLTLIHSPAPSLFFSPSCRPNRR